MNDSTVLNPNRNLSFDDLFTNITTCFTRRRSGLSAVLGAVLTSPGPVDCLAHLSLVTPGYTHSGLYAALTRGRVNTARLTKVLVEASNTDPLFCDVYNVDATSWLRPDAVTVEDLGYVYDAKAAKEGTYFTAPGWKYSVIARQGPDTGSWTHLVMIKRVKCDDDQTVFTVDQIKQVVTHHVGGRPLFVFDSGYSAHNLTHQLRTQNIAADILVRIDANRVFYTSPPAPVVRAAGQPARHGSVFRCDNPPVPEQTTSFTTNTHGTVTVNAWTGLHPRLYRGHTGMQDVGRLPVVEATILHVRSTAGKLGSRGWWLWYDGNDTNLDLKSLFYAYVHRFDIEHTFRFMKQTLGLTAYKPATATAADTWANVIACAYTLLVRARHVVAAKRLPWEKHLTWVKQTAGRVRRVINQHVTHLVSGLGVEVFKNHPPGRLPGTGKGPRTRHKVTRKHPKHE